MIIGLLGCLINNENLGCVAITYSVISILEEVSEKCGKDFTYYVFESSPDKEKTRYVAKNLNISEEKIKSFDVTPLFRYRRFLHHLNTGFHSLFAMYKCDLLIDMTGGDSFTDIYGQYIFDSETNVKYLVKKLGKKLVLGPQTYGPYNEARNFDKAIRIIEKADLVISRDQKSVDYIKEKTKKEVMVTTDVAFKLPFKHCEGHNTKKIRVGINISGLLLSDRTEFTPLQTKCRTDYDRYVKEVIGYLLTCGCYEVYCIPHVGNDGNVWAKKEYGDKVICCDQFLDPIAAKSFISSMDIFIGSRMHATIGAFSSGVATIPVAYSRKFSGLFNRLGYDYVVDLIANDTEKSVQETIGYISDYKKLEKAVCDSNLQAQNESQRNVKLLVELLENKK